MTESKTHTTNRFGGFFTPRLDPRRAANCLSVVSPNARIARLHPPALELWEELFSPCVRIPYTRFQTVDCLRLAVQAMQEPTLELHLCLCRWSSIDAALG